MKVFMSLVLVLAVLLSGVALAAGDGEAKKPAKTGEKELVQKTPQVVPFPVPGGGVVVSGMPAWLPPEARKAMFEQIKNLFPKELERQLSSPDFSPEKAAEEGRRMMMKLLSAEDYAEFEKALDKARAEGFSPEKAAAQAQEMMQKLFSDEGFTEFEKALESAMGSARIHVLPLPQGEIPEELRRLAGPDFSPEKAAEQAQELMKEFLGAEDFEEFEKALDSAKASGALHALPRLQGEIPEELRRAFAGALPGARADANLDEAIAELRTDVEQLKKQMDRALDLLEKLTDSDD